MINCTFENGNKTSLRHVVVHAIVEMDGKLLLLKRADPNRPHEDRQNVAFDLIVKPLERKTMPDKESLKVNWVAIENLPTLDGLAFDHGEIIKLYLEYRKKTFTLPLFA